MQINRQQAASILSRRPTTAADGGYVSESPADNLTGQADASLASGSAPRTESLQLRLEAAARELAAFSREQARHAYLAAAGVLTWFDPDLLRPIEGAEAGERPGARELLRDACVLGGRDGRAWMLRGGPRKQALKTLASRAKLQAARAANTAWPSPGDPLQAMLDQVIAEGTVDVATLDGIEAGALLQVIDWFDGLEGFSLPSREDVRRARDLAELLDRFRGLVGTHFRGRGAELQRLRDYVGVLPPASASEYVRRTVRKVLDLREEPPLLIYGPGGMGKSTLLAHFILDHLVPSPRLVFAYLDFDRVDLAIEQPASLLLEAGRQLAIQVDDREGLWKRWREEWFARVHAAAVEANLEAPAEPESVAQAADSGSALAATTQWIVNGFVRLFQATVPESRRPLLLVFDTFEEVQYRSREWVGELWHFLQDLQHAIPDLRTVVAGRAPIPEFGTLDLPLETLDADAAVGFLLGQGLPESQAARVARLVGGNPLSLKLAAEVARQAKAGEDAFAGLSNRRLILFAVKDELIQGQLYRRILGHIHDPRVRRLAHPGLVLRRITPALILEVLAVPCGVKVADLPDAEGLFAAMQAEISLVSVSPDGSLRHRPDVRRVMLALLEESNPEGVERIHRGAVEFYAREEGLEARAEELYHRLALGEDRETIESRWVDGVEPYLRGTLDEMPLHSRTLLASRIGLELPPEDWSNADQAEWEHRTAAKVSSLLAASTLSGLHVMSSRTATGATDQRRLEAALKLLGERTHRLPGSRLWLLDAVVAERLGRLEAARSVCTRGIEAMADGGEARTLLALQRTFVRVSLALDGALTDEVARILRDAWQMATAVGDGAVLEVGLDVLDLAGQGPAGVGPDDRVPHAEAADRVLDASQRLGDEYFASRQATVRRVAAHLGGRSPAALERGLRLAGLPLLDDRQARELADVLTGWGADVPPDHRPHFHDLLLSLGAPSAGDAGPWLAEVAARPESRSAVALQMLRAFPPSSERLARLAALMRDAPPDEPRSSFL